MPDADPGPAVANSPGNNAFWQTFLKMERQQGLLLQRQWMNKVRKELGFASLNLSERDRTQGAEESLASTLEKYRAAIKHKGHELIPKMDRLGICTKGLPDPGMRLEDLANLLARMDDLSLDRRIYADLTLTSQIDAVCSSLTARTRLCRLCLSVAEQIAAIPERMGEIDLDGLWPLKVGTFTRESFADGVRLRPPETVPEDDHLPFNVIRHQRDGATLLASARTCPVCELVRIAIILDSFRQCGFPLDRPTAELPEIILAIRTGSGDDEFKQILEGIRNSGNSIYLMVDGFSADSGKVLGHLRVLWRKPANMVGKDRERKVVFTKLSVFESESQQLAQYISTWQPLRNSGSAKALAQIRHWLRKCRAHHRCRDTISHQPMPEDELEHLPTRVIDVAAMEDDSKVRLFETAGSTKAHWVALSHCWGDKKNHPPKTTRANLCQHLNSIPILSLPKTFQDAVVTTRALGFRYLWIDSLCIVQDDEDDWHHESRMMTTIYEHATLTLAASDAIDSTRGLFLERPYAKIGFPSIHMPFITRDKTSGRRMTLGSYSISLDWRQEPFMKHMDPMFSPIYLRGWCTQELILSRRVVHFLNEGMVWVCKEKAVDETGQRLVAGQRHTESDWATEWGRIIVEHSVREFTFEKDRLISLEGLAREVSKASNNSCTPGGYFYGTWLVDIPEYILWASYRGRNRVTECPSWSWASCDSPVWLRFRDFDNMRPDELSQDCKVLGVDEQTGVLTISAIRVDISAWKLARMDRVSVHDLQGKNGVRAYRQPLIQGYAVSATDVQVTGWIEFDDERDALALPEPVFYLQLAEASYWDGPKVQYWGLLLQRHQSRSGAFKRVGMASLWGSEFTKTLDRRDTSIA